MWENFDKNVAWAVLNRIFDFGDHIFIWLLQIGETFNNNSSEGKAKQTNALLFTAFWLN